MYSIDLKSKFLIQYGYSSAKINWQFTKPLFIKRFL